MWPPGLHLKAEILEVRELNFKTFNAFTHQPKPGDPKILLFSFLKDLIIIQVAGIDQGRPNMELLEFFLLQ